MEIVLNFFNYHKDNIIFFEFRIRCIMLILEKVNYFSIFQKHYMQP